MSDCFTELRRELVDAHERYGERRAFGRAARVVHPRTWRPAAVLGSVAVAACAVAIALVVGGRTEPAPVGGLRVLAVVRMGGMPTDAGVGFGSLWISEFGGTVVRADPVSHRVLQRIRVGESAGSLVVNATGVWVATPPSPASDRGRLLRIDPSDGRVGAEASLATYSAALGGDDRALWALSDTEPQRQIERVDPRTARTIASARTRFVGVAVAVAGNAVWTLDRNGTLAVLDPRSGRPVRRLAGVAEAGVAGENALAADPRGVWAIAGAQQAIVRVEAGRIVRRIPMPSTTLPVLARRGASLWVAREESLGRYRLGRIDARTGVLRQTIDLGLHRPTALLATSGGLWVVAGDGTALLVGSGAGG